MFIGFSTAQKMDIFTNVKISLSLCILVDIGTLYLIFLGVVLCRRFKFTVNFFMVHTPVNKCEQRMNDVPIAARVPKQLKEKMKEAIKKDITSTCPI